MRPNRSVRGSTRRSYHDTRAGRVPITCGACRRNRVASTVKPDAASARRPSASVSVSPTAKGMSPVRDATAGGSALRNQIKGLRGLSSVRISRPPGTSTRRSSRNERVMSARSSKWSSVEVERIPSNAPARNGSARTSPTVAGLATSRVACAATARETSRPIQSASPRAGTSARSGARSSNRSVLSHRPRTSAHCATSRRCSRRAWRRQPAGSASGSSAIPSQ